MRDKAKMIALRTLTLLMPLHLLHAAIQIQNLSPSQSSPQPVGTTIVWQATATDGNPGTLDYRFSTKAVAGPNFTIVRDFHTSNSFEWTQSLREGVFQIQVTVRNQSTQETAQATANFQVTPRAVGASPVITRTGKPLVALYSAPPCPTGSSMRVTFQKAGAPVGEATSYKPCTGSLTMNFYLVGMLPTSVYAVRHEILTGTSTTVGPLLPFVTGVIPPSLVFPTITVPVPPNAQTSLQQNVVLHDYLATSTIYFPTATNLAGQVVWYYDKISGAEQSGRHYIRPIAGQSMLLFLNDASIPEPELRGNTLMREIDLAGNTLRETSSRRVSEQLVAMGLPAISQFHHDAIRLPNGHTLALTAAERIFPPGTQGSSGPVDIIGDIVVDLDENLQVVWAWNSFDHMDINRAALLGETCIPLQGGCPPLLLDDVANDWLHSNSLNYSPATGDFLISIRHQDWVVKIDYKNGTGTGNVLWRLGKDGDFTLNSSDPYPWFSHQHDAGYELGGTTFLSIFDNGNTRVGQAGSGNSRGQVYLLNEANRTAGLALNADLGVYAPALGSAARLGNGNVHFEAGLVTIAPDTVGQAIEVLPSGGINYTLQSLAATYRSYRLTSLYTPLTK